MKKIRKYCVIIYVLFLTVLLSGCATSAARILETDESQVKLRSIQTRAFDTTDKEKMMRTVISTMQDLDFVLGKADLMLGSVTGTKFLGNAVVTMTVTVRPRGEKQLLVRANAQYGISSVEDPETYQDFFNSLGKALFLTAQQID
jgi:hypothetical protein